MFLETRLLQPGRFQWQTCTLQRNVGSLKGKGSLTTKVNVTKVSPHSWTFGLIAMVQLPSTSHQSPLDRSPLLKEAKHWTKDTWCFQLISYLHIGLVRTCQFKCCIAKPSPETSIYAKLFLTLVFVLYIHKDHGTKLSIWETQNFHRKITAGPHMFTQLAFGCSIKATHLFPNRQDF